MNRYARGLLTGSLLGMAAAGTAMAVGARRRRVMAQMMNSRRLGNRARRTFRVVRDNAMRLGSAVRSGTVSFAEQMSQRRNWGRT